MKHMRKFLFVLFLTFGTVLYSLEIEAVAGAGNMVFDTDRETSLGSKDKHFTGNTFVLGHFNLRGDFSDLIGYSVRFERDMILRNMLSGKVELDLVYLNLELGPIMGTFNSHEQPVNAGIQGGLKLLYPGIIFGSFSGSTTLGPDKGFTGDYTQSCAELNMGFWLPNIISSFSFTVKNFTIQEDDYLLIRDELMRYRFSADIFSKNVPYTIRVDMGYQVLTRSYSEYTDTDTDELKALFIGFEGKLHVASPVCIILGLEMPVYTWAGKPMKNPETDLVFYKFHSGVSLTFLKK